MLNRLAANGLDGAQPFAVARSWAAQAVEFPGAGVLKPDLQSRTPEQIISDLQATGHTVTVTDSRYFANFAHLHFNGKDVMAPVLD